MYRLKSLSDKSPIVLSGAVVAVVNFLIVCRVVTLDAQAVSALNIALMAVLNLFVSNKTANKAVLDELSEDK